MLQVCLRCIYRFLKKWIFRLKPNFFFFCSQPLSSCNLVLLVHPLVMRSRKSVQDSRIGAMPSLQVTQVKRTCNCFKSCCWTVSKQTTETGQGPPGTQAPCGEAPGDTAKAHKTTFFFCERLPASMARSLHCIEP